MVCGCQVILLNEHVMVMMMMMQQAFVGCTLGIWKIGLVTLPYGLANACTSIASGHVVNYTGRLPVFLFGMSL